MLVLSRKAAERILIGDHIEVQILSIRGNVVRLGIKAPRDVSVFRSEIVEQPVTEDRKPVKASPLQRHRQLSAAG